MQVKRMTNRWNSEINWQINCFSDRAQNCGLELRESGTSCEVYQWSRYVCTTKRLMWFQPSPVNTNVATRWFGAKGQLWGLTMAMQMIYSAGTTSHSPRCSPVPPRKYPSPRPSPRASPREWRPVMPGYKPPAGHALVPYSRSPEIEHNPIIVTEDDINLKDFIPAMPRSIAITCLVCNILFPALGELKN